MAKKDAAEKKGAAIPEALPILEKGSALLHELKISGSKESNLKLNMLIFSNT
jgi:hypothetical protein